MKPWTNPVECLDAWLSEPENLPNTLVVIVPLAWAAQCETLLDNLGLGCRITVEADSSEHAPSMMVLGPKAVAARARIQPLIQDVEQVFEDSPHCF